MSRASKKQGFFTRHLAVLYFLISFGCCVILGGSAAFFVYKTVLAPSVPAAEIVSSAAPLSASAGQSSEIDAKDTFNLFLTLLDSAGSPVQFSVFRLDAAKKEFVYMVIPTDLMVTLGSGKVSIADYYGYKGPEKTVAAFFSLTRIKADYTMVVESSAFVSAFDKLGGFAYVVPENVTYTAPGGAKTKVKKGTNELNGKEALALISSAGYSGGGIQQYRVQSDLMKLFLLEKLKGKYLDRAEDYFSGVLGQSQTTFRIGDLTSRIGTFQDIASQDGNYIKNPDPEFTPVIVGNISLFEYGAGSSSRFYSTFGAK